MYTRRARHLPVLCDRNPDHEPISEPCDKHPDHEPISESCDKYPDHESISESCDKYPDHESISEPCDKYPDREPGYVRPQREPEPRSDAGSMYDCQFYVSRAGGMSVQHHQQ